MRTLQVKTVSANYPVLIGRNLFPRVARWLPRLSSSIPSSAFILTSPEIWALWGKKFLAAFAKENQPTVLFLPAGERFKRLSQIERLASELAAAGADRSSLLIALGGGIVGDLAGFLAAIYIPKISRDAGNQTATRHSERRRGDSRPYLFTAPRIAFWFFRISF